jgi:hypothetical protein
MGGFLQTAVSDAPRTTWRTYLRSLIGRIRYSTSVSGQRHVLFGIDDRSKEWLHRTSTAAVLGNLHKSAPVEARKG